MIKTKPLYRTANRVVLLFILIFDYFLRIRRFRVNPSNPPGSKSNSGDGKTANSEKMTYEELIDEYENGRNLKYKSSTGNSSHHNLGHHHTHRHNPPTTLY